MCLLYILFIRNFSYPPVSDWPFGCALIILIYCIGSLNVMIKSDINEKRHFSNIIEENQKQLCFSKIEKVQLKESSTRLVIGLKAFHTSQGVKSVTGKALLYIRNEWCESDLRTGQRLLLRCRFKAIQSNEIPGTKNWKEHFQKKGIYYSCQISNADDVVIIKTERDFFASKKDKLRHYIHSIISNVLPSKSEQSVFIGMFLGDKSMLSDEMKLLFSESGVMHVLAVSGLHVGMIYFFLLNLLRFFDVFDRGVIIKSLLIIFFIWMYAFITGFSASVTRASFMFSLLVVSKLIHKRTNIFNILALSAFTLLILDPSTLFEIGFQLSHLAVMGIALLYPIVNGIIKTNIWIIQKVWSLLSVTIVAQIITFPLILYYFHSFPNYFLIANMLAIPLVTVIVFAGIFLMIFSFIPVATSIIAQILQFSIKLLIWSLKWITSLPFSVSYVYINQTDLISIYLIIIAIILSLLLFKKWPIKCLVAYLFVVIIIHSVNRLQAAHLNRLYVLSVKDNLYIGIVESNQHTIICMDHGVKELPDEILKFTCYERLPFPVFHSFKSLLSPINQKNGSQTVSFRTSFGDLLYISGEISNLKRISLSNKLSIKYLVLDGISGEVQTLLSNRINPKHIIVKGSDRFYTTKFESLNSFEFSILGYKDHIELGTSSSLK